MLAYSGCKHFLGLFGRFSEETRIHFTRHYRKAKVGYGNESEEREEQSEAEAKHHTSRDYEAKAYGSRATGKAFRVEPH